MKKFLLFVVFIVIALDFGYAAKKQRQIDVSLSGDSVDRYIITVTKESQFGDALYEKKNPDKFINGFAIEVKNSTSGNIRINWNNCSISDAEGTYRVFLSGQKYVNANDPIPPLVIPPNGKVNRTVCSADHVEYVTWGKTWRINPMKGLEFTVVLCIEDSGNENYVNVNIKVTP